MNTDKHTLVERVIQFGYPKILSLNSKDPAEFQEAIRDNYPLYNFETTEQSGFKGIHQFISGNQKSKVTLAGNFISLSTLENTTSWTNLRDNFLKILRTCDKIYEIPFYNYITLHYTNTISKQKLGLEGVSWRELVKPEHLGALVFTDNDESITNSTINIEYYLDESNLSKVKATTGLGKTLGEEELQFISKVDFIYTQTSHTSTAKAILDFLHSKAQDMFTSMTTEKLHQAANTSEII